MGKPDCPAFIADRRPPSSHPMDRARGWFPPSNRPRARDQAKSGRVPLAIGQKLDIRHDLDGGVWKLGGKERFQIVTNLRRSRPRSSGNNEGNGGGVRLDLCKVSQNAPFPFKDHPRRPVGSRENRWASLGGGFLHGPIRTSDPKTQPEMSAAAVDGDKDFALVRWLGSDLDVVKGLRNSAPGSEESLASGGRVDLQKGNDNGGFYFALALGQAFFRLV